MKYRIVSDSSSNLLHMEAAAEYKTVPLKIIIGEKEYPDVDGIDLEDLVDRIEQSEKNSTSCPNSQEWLDAFEGADRIFCVTISSNLSGSYASAVLARNMYLEEHPDARIHVVDSLSTGGDMQLLIEKLQAMIAEGMDFDDIVKGIGEYQQTTRILFILESLQNLAKNGRVSIAVAKAANLLGIRFIGKASEEGTIQQSHIARGPKRALSTTVSDMMRMGYAGGKVRISHCLNMDFANRIKESLLSSFPQADVVIDTCGALCSYYAERGGTIIGFEVGV